MTFYWVFEEWTSERVDGERNKAVEPVLSGTKLQELVRAMAEGVFVDSFPTYPYTLYRIPHYVRFATHPCFDYASGLIAGSRLPCPHRLKIQRGRLRRDWLADDLPRPLARNGPRMAHPVQLTFLSPSMCSSTDLQRYLAKQRNK